MSVRQFLKQTTRLVGLPVEAEPHKVLTGLYKQTLEAVKQIPPEAEYRVAVEKITQHRLGVVNSEPNVQKIEEKIGCGQVEELIQQAKSELELIPKMAEWRAWENNPIPAPNGQWSLPK